MTTLVAAIFLLSAVLFIFGLKQLAKVRTARSGNTIAAAAMAMAVVGTLVEIHQKGSVDYRWMVGGVVIGTVIGGVMALRVAMTAMPEMVAIFNGFGGAASWLVAVAVVWKQLVERDGVGAAVTRLPGGVADAVTIALSVLIGTVTLSGSYLAYLKLQGKLRKGAPILLPGRHAINIVLTLSVCALSVWLGWFALDRESVMIAVIALSAVALVLGVLLVLPIGGADMPVVVCLLNSYSGLAGCAAGFVVGNHLLIIAGSLVGASGIILTKVMCDAMNRSLLSVLLGGFGIEASDGSSSEYKNVRSCGAEEAVMVLESASTAVFVPGYGLAVAQAQHAVRELAELLEKRGTKVRYAIHPVAGRMPGHMNILLAEADVPYEDLVEMDQINADFRNTDVTIVIGANDVVNPVAKTDPKSPIYGMPILEAHESRSVFVIKRSLGAGYAGIKNELFEMPNTVMIYGDAKKVLQALANELKQSR